MHKTTRIQKGFTIIEVLIVLAIAGLILLIVFLAVPALQRNSRNTQARSEAKMVSGAVQEFVTNAGSTLPNPGTSSTSGTDAAAILKLANTRQIIEVNVGAYASIAPQTPNFELAIAVPQTKCGSVGGASVTPTIVAASGKSIAVIYALENADGSVSAQCIQL